jgi:hypothetical protein
MSKPLDDLPQGCIYVMSATDAIPMAARAVIAMGRADITIVTPLFLTEDALSMLPAHRPIVVAPGVKLEPEQKQVLAWHSGELMPMMERG